MTASYANSEEMMRALRRHGARAASAYFSGMGPVDPLKTEAGKWLAGTYALLAGLVVLVVAGVMLAPMIHHVLQHYGFDEGNPKSSR